MTATRLLLVRHGESTWNAVRRWQGQADPPLSERGIDQARRAATTAAEYGPFDEVVSSSLQRARRTAEILSTALGVDLLDPVAALSERAAGPWEGLTRAEIERRYPGFLADGRRPPGYESDREIVARSSAALHELRRRHPGSRLLVVSHGGTIHGLERASAPDGEWVRLDNLSCRWFEVTDDAVTPVGKRLALIPDGGPR